MSDSQLMWLNVTNAILGILVLLPVLVILFAILAEIGTGAWRRIAPHVRFHPWTHRLAHTSAHR